MNIWYLVLKMARYSCGICRSKTLKIKRSRKFRLQHKSFRKIWYWMGLKSTPRIQMKLLYATDLVHRTWSTLSLIRLYKSMLLIHRVRMKKYSVLVSQLMENMFMHSQVPKICIYSRRRVENLLVYSWSRHQKMR